MNFHESQDSKPSTKLLGMLAHGSNAASFKNLALEILDILFPFTGSISLPITAAEIMNSLKPIVSLRDYGVSCFPPQTVMEFILGTESCLMGNQ